MTQSSNPASNGTAPVVAAPTALTHPDAFSDTLCSDAVAFVNRRLISGEKLRDFKSNVRYENLAFDLMGLVALLRQPYSHCHQLFFTTWLTK